MTVAEYPDHSKSTCNMCPTHGCLVQGKEGVSCGFNGYHDEMEICVPRT